MTITPTLTSLVDSDRPEEKWIQVYAGCRVRVFINTVNSAIKENIAAQDSFMADVILNTRLQRGFCFIYQRLSCCTPPLCI